METRRDVIVRTAVLADELGYEIFALPEGWGLDPARPHTRCAWASRLPPRYPSGSPRWASTPPGWPPNSVTAGSPRWWPGTACPAGRPSSASYAKPPYRTRGPSP